MRRKSARAVRRGAAGQRPERDLASRLLYLEKRCRPHLKATTDSWRVDETYVKVKTVWMYLYRAVDCQGNTLEFLPSPTAVMAGADPVWGTGRRISRGNMGETIPVWKEGYS
jgi:hypothetical protein